MHIKKIKRKCMVKGCKNVESYAISKIREMGGVIICRDCLEQALNAVNDTLPQKEAAATKVNVTETAEKRKVTEEPAVTNKKGGKKK